jgi:hypothetical protein
MRRVHGRTDLGRGPEKWRYTILFCFFFWFGFGGFKWFLALFVWFFLSFLKFELFQV